MSFNNGPIQDWMNRLGNWEGQGCMLGGRKSTTRETKTSVTSLRGNGGSHVGVGVVRQVLRCQLSMRAKILSTWQEKYNSSKAVLQIEFGNLPFSPSVGKD